MPRDLSGSGRSVPHLFHQPLAFYTAIRLSDPEVLSQIMSVDPFFVTQDNGAGSPLHFAVTYKRLDMALNLLNLGAEVNQKDARGYTPLHRAAFLAHIEGYMELYEFLLSRGADPSILSHASKDYLNPGRSMAIDLVVDDGGETRSKVKALEDKYDQVVKIRVPHQDIGDWITLYDFGLDQVKCWSADYEPQYPEVLMRKGIKGDKLKAKEEKMAERARILQTMDSSLTPSPSPIPSGSPVAFLFPGQGSQVVGMLSMAKDLPKVKEMLSMAHQILGFDLLDICINGPTALLDSTKIAQPALLVADLAAAEMYKIDQEAPSLYAGLSLGEYAALISAGAMSFEDGLRVVKVRSEEMGRCATSTIKPQGMLSVVGVDDVVLTKICSSALEEVKKKNPGLEVVCQISNYLFPQGRVVSGHIECLSIVEELAKGKGALKTIFLAVSGAFHTPLMEPARQALVKALASIEIHKPLMPVISNVTGLPFPDDPDAIRSLLARQLVEPVLWESSLKYIIAQGKSKLVECGPGSQIKSMMRRLNPNAWKEFQNIQP